MTNADKHARRAESVWDKALERQPRARTPHDVAMAYAKARWSGHGTRAAWENAVCRYKGPFKLPNP
jgi:hypothetical protein